MRPVTSFEYRYRVTRAGSQVGWATAEYHGAAAWQVDHPAFVDPGEPRTIERLDAALYASGFELVPEE
jgi:sirohydrochlorin ferrochelatase